MRVLPFSTTVGGDVTISCEHVEIFNRSFKKCTFLLLETSQKTDCPTDNIVSHLKAHYLDLTSIPYESVF